MGADGTGHIRQANRREGGKAVLVNCIAAWRCSGVNESQLKAYGLDDIITLQDPGSQAPQVAQPGLTLGDGPLKGGEERGLGPRASKLFRTSGTTPTCFRKKEARPFW